MVGGKGPHIAVHDVGTNQIRWLPPLREKDDRDYGIMWNEVAVTPGGRVAASADEQGGAAGMGCRDRVVAPLDRGVHGPPDGCGAAHDGRIAACADYSGSVHIWDLAVGTLLRVLVAHVGVARSIALSADGRIVATGGDDMSLRVWDAALRAAAPHTRRARRSHQCSRVIGQRSDRGHRLVRLHSTGLGPGIRAASSPIVPGQVGAVRAVTATPDGRVIATAGDDRAIRIWDGERGRLVLDLPGAPRYGETCLDPYGNVLCWHAVSDDGSV